MNCRHGHNIDWCAWCDGVERPLTGEEQERLLRRTADDARNLARQIVRDEFTRKLSKPVNV